MNQTVLVVHHDRIWTASSLFMRDVYRQIYGAELGQLPRRMLVRLDAFGDVVCAAGLRTAAEGFFSEHYLDRPIEDLLTDIVDHPVGRDAVCEVTTLVSRAPHETSEFIDDIVRCLAELDFDWSFYTLTRRLALMLRHKRLSPFDLAPALPDRVPTPEKWGRYYATAPRVYAVSIDHLPATERYAGVLQHHAVHSRSTLSV